jgi:hypothetical protein
MTEAEYRLQMEERLDQAISVGLKWRAGFLSLLGFGIGWLVKYLIAP